MSPLQSLQISLFIMAWCSFTYLTYWIVKLAFKLWNTTVRELWRKLDLFLEKFWRMQYDATFYEIEEKEKEDL